MNKTGFSRRPEHKIVLKKFESENELGINSSRLLINRDLNVRSEIHLDHQVEQR